MSSTTKKKSRGGKSFIKFLSSVPLAISLLILMGLLAFAGTLIPQADIFSYEEISAYNQAHPAINFINKIISSCQIADRDPLRSSIYAVYHSWWFLLSVLLLALNLAVCTLKKLPVLRELFRGFNGSIPADSGKRIEMNFKMSRDDAVEAVRNWSSKKFRIREEKVTSDGTAFRFQKGRIGRTGYIFVHIGILAVIAGAMVSALTREKGYVWLSEGEETDRYYSRTTDMELPLGYNLKAQKLKVEMNKTGNSVKDWLSNLAIIKDGTILAEKTIQVNDPLTFEGRSFYQSSWSNGYSFSLKIIDKKTGVSKVFPLSVGNNLLNTEGVDKTYSFPDKSVFFRLHSFYPDFIITNEGFATRSQELKNPAAVLLVYWEGLTEAKRKIVFAKVREMDFMRMHPKESAAAEPFHFMLEKDIKTMNVTGIEISVDKGTEIVYVGFYFAIFGIFASFYFNHRKIWILAKSGKGRCDMVFCGTTHRNKQVFYRELEKTADSFKKFAASRAKKE